MEKGKKNKVRFGLKNVHYAVLKSVDENGTPTYDTPKAIPGAVSLSFDVEGEAEPFYADNIVYYMVNNNSGYSGDLEIALIPTEFATEIMGETLDENGVLVETSTAELQPFALMFEFTGDKNGIRHVMHNCYVARPGTEGSTDEDKKTVATEKLSFTANPLANGLVKAKSCESTNAETYAGWYKSVYIPEIKDDPEE